MVDILNGPLHTRSTVRERGKEKERRCSSWVISGDLWNQSGAPRRMNRHQGMPRRKLKAPLPRPLSSLENPLMRKRLERWGGKLINSRSTARLVIPDTLHSYIRTNNTVCSYLLGTALLINQCCRFLLRLVGGDLSWIANDRIRIAREIVIA